MAIVNKIKYLNIDFTKTIEEITSSIATALECNSSTSTVTINKVEGTCGILTMETDSSKAGFAIIKYRDFYDSGDQFLQLYIYVNGSVLTGDHIKAIHNTMSYILDDDYKLFGDNSPYFGWGFLKGKDLSMPNAPVLWTYYTLYSGNSTTTYIKLWNEKNEKGTSYVNQQNLIALSNEGNSLVLAPIFNEKSDWLMNNKGYYVIKRPSPYNTAGQVYNFIMDGKEYILLTPTNVNTFNWKNVLCFDITDIPDIPLENENEE